jgi:ketosteroid isomerase-like protein
MTDGNIELAREILGAWSRRDVDAVVALMHEDVEWQPAMTGGVEGAVYRGEEGMRRYFNGLDDAWAELSVEPSEVLEVGEDRVLLLGEFHAVGKASGVRIDQPQAILMTFRRGQVIAARGFASHTDAYEAAGLRS